MTGPAGIRVEFVVAVAANGVIGVGGALPWHIPEDLRRFKRLTMGKPIVMGRRTFASIGRALPGRLNIVVSRDPTFFAEGVTVATSIVAAVDAAARHAVSTGTDALCVIGGADLFRATLPLADRIHLTAVHAAPEGDVHFPDLDRSAWSETWRENHAGDPAYSFMTLDRIAR